MANKITKRNSFIEFMLTQIELLQDSNRFGTAQNYKSTLNSFNSFLNYKDVSFKLITSDLIESYNAYLIKRNIIWKILSCFLRNKQDKIFHYFISFRDFTILVIKSLDEISWFIHT